MLPTKPEEEKRKELIDELLKRGEPVISRAVESAPGCRLENGILFLDYQDSVYKPWAKALTDYKQKPRLEAAAEQVGIEVRSPLIDGLQNRATYFGRLLASE
jgi:hypothetical protein